MKKRSGSVMKTIMAGLMGAALAACLLYTGRVPAKAAEEETTEAEAAEDTAEGNTKTLYIWHKAESEDDWKKIDELLSGTKSAAAADVPILLTYETFNNSQNTKGYIQAIGGDSEHNCSIRTRTVYNVVGGQFICEVDKDQPFFLCGQTDISCGQSAFITDYFPGTFFIRKGTADGTYRLYDYTEQNDTYVPNEKSHLTATVGNDWDYFIEGNTRSAVPYTWFQEGNSPALGRGDQNSHVSCKDEFTFVDLTAAGHAGKYRIKLGYLQTGNNYRNFYLTAYNNYTWNVDSNQIYHEGGNTDFMNIEGPGVKISGYSDYIKDATIFSVYYGEVITAAEVQDLSSENPLISAGNTYTLNGSTEGTYYYIPEGKNVTVEQGGMLTVGNNATLMVYGSIINKGTIVVQPGGKIVNMANDPGGANGNLKCSGTSSVLLSENAGLSVNSLELNDQSQLQLELGSVVICGVTKAGYDSEIVLNGGTYYNGIVSAIDLKGTEIKDWGTFYSSGQYVKSAKSSTWNGTIYRTDKTSQIVNVKPQS